MLLEDEINKEHLKKCNEIFYKVFQCTFVCMVLYVAFCFWSIDFSDTKYLAVLHIVDVVMSLIPIIYYKSTKNHRYFWIIGLVVLEYLSFSLNINAWFGGMIAWTFSTGFACLYFKRKLVKVLVFCNIVLYSISSIIGVYMCPLTYTRNIPESVKFIGYFVLQMVAIGFIFFMICRRNEEIFQSCVQKTEQMKDTWDNTQESSEKINDNLGRLCELLKESQNAIKEISESSTIIMQKSTEVSENTEGANKSVGNIFDKIELSSQNSSEMSNMTNRLNEITKKNESNIESLYKEMNGMEQATQESIQAFEVFERSAKGIADALTLINQLADQVTLVALNASIEAARAGEAGRGFNIVASEIKSLANQTMESADSINQIVEEVESNTKRSLSSIENTRKAVKSNMEVLSYVQKDFSTMTSVQGEMNQKIFHAQELMNQLKTYVGTVKEALENTLGESKDTSDSIVNISGVIEELYASFDEVMNYSEKIYETTRNLVAFEKQEV